MAQGWITVVRMMANGGGFVNPEDAKAGPALSGEIQRLYYLTSHLNAGPGSRIESWKLPLVTAAAPVR